MNQDSDYSGELTLNQQNYIETIFELCQAHGHAHTKAIAESLGIKMASVTEALRSLSAKKLINYEVRKTITLTEHGELVAGELARRHKILAAFFHDILGCSHARANEVACRIEHVIDERLKNRIAEFVLFLKSSEHGGEIISAFQQRYQRMLDDLEAK